MSAAAGGAARIVARLDALAAFTDDPPALTRLYLSPAHRAAAEATLEWMREAGMSAAIDALGTVVGRYEASRPGAPALLLGSHLDTVPNAGRFDGSLGVVTAIEAVAGLLERGRRLPFAVEVLAFGDEEGVRFPATLTSSRAIAGRVEREALDARDRSGASMAEALRVFGGDPAGIHALARDPEQVLGYLEVHIEQGPVLEHEALPLGVVTAICGCARFLIEVTGEAGHAGTVPMGARKDALAAAAEMLLAVERRAAGGAEPGLVATVGRIEAVPGAVNVIPGACRFTLDVRAPRDDHRAKAIEDLTAAFATLAARRGVALKIERTHEAPATPCDRHLVAALEAAVVRRGCRSHLLPSGGGHDGVAVASLCPIGMLFVRCRGGVSHHPAESVEPADIALALDVLGDTLEHLHPATLRGRT